MCIGDNLDFNTVSNKTRKRRGRGREETVGVGSWEEGAVGGSRKRQYEEVNGRMRQQGGRMRRKEEEG